MALILAFWLGWISFRLRFWLHLYQLEDYENLRFFRWVAERPRTVWDWRSALAGGATAGLSLVLSGVGTAEGWDWALVAVWLGWMGAFVLHRPVRDAKKPLVMTARARRLFVTGLALHGGLAALLASLGPAFSQNPIRSGIFESAVAVSLASQTTPFLLIVANLVLWPVEQLIRRAYLGSARRKLRAVAPRIIAVTGSYGKTTTKEIIAHILSGRYRVLKTPESYNTLMGVCKVIRGGLLPEHEFFVVEMGAYRRGSIARLCRLTPPSISVLTTIGLQHLERFRSVKNIKLAKAEIIQALSPGGVAVLNGDNPLCREVEQLTRGRVIRFGLGPSTDLDVRATDIRFGTEGVEFVLHTKGKNAVHVSSRLLGRHNVMNILAAAAVALEAGLSPEDVRDLVRTIGPVPHRLQPIAGIGGVTIIDDAYNANPEGAIAALETLHEFPGRKILITPGLVELGERGFEENKNIGGLAARVCDHVLLVGPKQTFAIQEGLKEGGFDGKNLSVFADSQEAIQYLRNITRPGDVILFENDLPDQYDERLQGVSERQAHAKA